MIDRFKIESSLYKSGAQLVIGVDEVGRGPLAGPVVAAAVSFKNNLNEDWWEQITDSKKLSLKKRDYLYKQILKNSLHSFGVASVEEIEQLNILQASLLAMHRAVDDLLKQSNHSNTFVLIDGRNIIPNLPVKQESIVRGDSLIHSIAAASVIAKVYRDNLMQQFAEQFPNYGLEKHKGYGTKFHIEAIRKHGLSIIHRPSFCTNFI